MLCVRSACFGRRSVQQGRYNQCFACRHPLSESDLLSEFYEEGVSCQFCFDSKSKSAKTSFVNVSRSNLPMKEVSSIWASQRINSLVQVSA